MYIYIYIHICMHVPSQFSKYMYDRKRSVWLSLDDFDCYDKRLSKISVKIYIGHIKIVQLKYLGKSCYITYQYKELETLNKYATCNRKCIRSIVKFLLQLRNFLRQLWQDPDCVTINLKTGNTNRHFYIKQINYCVSLSKKAKKRYYDDLNERWITDNIFSGKQ